MNKLIWFVAAIICINVAFAEGTLASPLVTIDGAVSLSSDSYWDDEFGNTIGYGVGANLDWSKTKRDARVVMRTDLSYEKWKNSTTYTTWSFTKIPLFLGVRFYTPWYVFIEGGLEVVYEEWKSSYTGPLFGILSTGSNNSSRSYTAGFAPGIGVEFPLSGNMTCGIHARYHVGPDFHGTLGGFVGYHF